MTTKKQRDMAAIMAMRRKDLTPYDTGKRAEPKVWINPVSRDSSRTDDDYGKVDFDADSEYTIATLYIEQEDDKSYTLKGYANEALKVELEDEELPVLLQPTAALQANVKKTINNLGQYERDSAEVYWEWKRAMILVPGEKHVRKQLLIFVTDVGDGEPNSAFVKDWGTGIRDTRIG